MQYSVENLLKELRAGKNVDDLAHEVIDNVNKANALFQEEEEKRSAEKYAAERKLRKADEVAAAFNNFVNEYYTAAGETPIKITGEDMVNSLDSYKEFLALFASGF